MIASAPAQPLELDLPLPPPPQQAQPYRLALPEGFITLTIDQHAVLCEPGDEQWIRQALDPLDPPAPPTTMPSDLLQRLHDVRPEIVEQLTAALALDDPAVLDPLFDQRLLPPLRTLSQLRPPICFLVTTPQRLRELLRSGWTNPNLHYNRAADDVAFEPVLQIHLDGNMDELVWPILLDSDLDPTRRDELLRDNVQTVAANAQAAIAQRALLQLQSTFTDAIRDLAFQPFALGLDQQWLAAGVSGVLAARCTSHVSQIPFEQVMHDLTADPPRAPVKADSVDLLSPPDVQSLRPEYVPLYNQAMNRRALRVAETLLEEAGYHAAGLLLAAMRQQTPPDGEALVQLVRDVTGADLLPHLKPR
jgi:hypothetical protein